jgi:molecular chaperone GrpE
VSQGKKIEIETSAEEAEEPSGGSLAPDPELEEALRAAAEAVGGRPAAPPEGGGPGGAPPEGEAEGSEDLSLELKQTQDRLLRLQADFENFRRRALKEKTEAHQYGHQNLVKDLLSAVDNLDRAIDHASRSGGGDLESLLQGVELVRRDLLGALAKNGVMPIEALGQPFDPALHEAMAQAPDDTVAPNTVVEELQKGYKLRDRLLRPSRVVVARAPDGDDVETSSEAAQEEGVGD